ncbi:MAG: hypothetical protein LBQ11_00925, partial [Candidatus Nomurabacteria bacterium]|nr:hypothetical protein [Candidatus Nomurabacteria bacterium]
MKRKSLLILICFLSVAAIAVGLAETVTAHYGALNTPEANAPGLCKAQTRFTMWANSSSTGSDHSTSITVTNPATNSVTLYLHRAAYGCLSPFGLNYPMGAKWISISVNNGLSISNVPSGCVMFGYVPASHAYSGYYYDSSTTVPFTLNGITNLPYGTTNASLTVSRYNGGACVYGNDGDGSSGTETMTLTITRPLNWHIDLQTTASSERTPGQTITFTHSAKSHGPTITDKQVNFSISHASSTTDDNNWTSSVPSVSKKFNSGRAADSSYEQITTETKLITQADVGKYVCSQLVASPGGGGSFSSANRSSNTPADDSGAGTPLCIYIPYDYNLTPVTTVSTGAYGSTSGFVNYDELAIFEGNIQNENGPTKSRSVNWDAFIFVIPNSDSDTPTAKNKVSSAALNASYVSAIYGVTVSHSANHFQTIGTRAGKGGCAIHSARDVFYPPKRTSSDPEPTNNETACKTSNLADIMNTLNLGDRLCFALRVSPSWATPANQTATDYNYSTPACLQVSKSPQIQLKGADSKSGAAKFGQTDVNSNGGFIGRYSSNPDRGSW